MNYSINRHWQYTPKKTDLPIEDPLLMINDVCDIICRLFDYTPNSPLHIIDEDYGYPSLMDNAPIIFLDTAGTTYYSQNAYQLSHELCHFIIRERCGGIGDTTWFEESICELCSIVALEHLAVLWKNSKDQRKTCYSPFIESYRLEIVENCQSIPLTDLWKHNSELLKLLNSNPYLREQNRSIANSMRSIFLICPNLWKDIHLIRYQKPTNLDSYFNFLCTNCRQENTQGFLLLATTLNKPPF